MESREALRVFNSHRSARFVVENHFVLRAVVFENAADILETRNYSEQRQQDSETNHAVYYRRPNLSIQNWIDTSDFLGKEERHKLIGKEKECKRRHNRRGHGPPWDLRIRLLCGSLQLGIIQRGRGGKLQRLSTEFKSLIKSPDASENR